MSQPNLQAYTLEPIPNSQYMYDLHYRSNETLTGPGVAIMMMVSVFQYDPGYFGPKYSDGLSKAGQVASSSIGVDVYQKKMLSLAATQAKGVANDIGVSTGEMAVVLGAANVIKTRRIEFNGPNILWFKSKLTVEPTNGTLGLKYEW